MSAAKHTSGPWRAAYDGHGGMSVECDEGQIGFVSNRRSQEANARLIAAAPELLEALRGYVAFAAMRRHELGELSPEMEVVDAVARAAIAKAEVQS